jgi:hypothetical protein
MNIDRDRMECGLSDEEAGFVESVLLCLSGQSAASVRRVLRNVDRLLDDLARLPDH